MRRLLPIALLLAGCNEASLVDGALAPCGVETDRFVQSAPAVDVLFVVDDSSSMAHEQQRLEDSFDEFIGWLEGESVSYHLGVTTTSVTTGVGGWLVGSPAWVANETPDALSQFKNNAKVGIAGAGVEQGLEAAFKLLAIEMTEETGFLRRDAKLALVFVSDEDDDSKRTIEEYATFYLAQKSGDANKLLVHAVAGEVENECEGLARPGTRYRELVDRLHGRFTSICEPSFAPALETIASDASGRERLLAAKPDVSTISIRVNGVALDASRWSYDLVRNAVVFATAPAAGDEVEVSYERACHS